MSFSERQGYMAPRSAFQKESLDKPTRNRLINLVIVFYLTRSVTHFLDEAGKLVVIRLVDEFFKNPIDRITDDADFASRMLINWSSDCKWFSLFDLLEFVINDDLNDADELGPKGKRFAAACNELFETERVAYRFVNNQIVSIVDEQEMAAIEESLALPEVFSGVRAHIRRALELYSDRTNPDYRNTIKESILAVESACKVISKKNKATLTDAIKIIEKNHAFHPALKDALLKLYGYSNDKQGIRHALVDEASVGHAEAKFMLIGCTAFCNYLIEQYGDQ